jgi:putative CocE/NonD family hydrolase
LQPEGKLAFTPPTAAYGFTAYTSAPAKPVPHSPRPQFGYDYGVHSIIGAWRRWLVEDQRFADGRPDVATWESEPLTEPLTLRGPITVKLYAETTGTDADWVVKLIDVHPDDAPDAQMSGYQLMLSGDIFRGRYRESLEQPKPITANQVLEYNLTLPHVNHTILPGHRLMVQVQSTWFPLYDRKPQTYVPNITTAPPGAYKAQRHRVQHSAQYHTHVTVLVDAAK